jgi:predicted ATPase
MAAEAPITFAHGSEWLRADFHLHTKADKEFSYTGQENAFVAAYVDRLVEEKIRLGVITNHNKFDAEEFKALRKRARKQGIGLMPGIELSVGDGANGVHTLVVFSEAWLENGNDYINNFLNVAFAGKTPVQYEHENGRTQGDLLTILETLAGYGRDFFVVFAHVEANSGLWKELHGGRMQELAAHPLIQKYCRGFQKVRTHDKPGAKCRAVVKTWWPQYPAEVEGSDPKSLEEIGKGELQTYVKIGDFTFDAVKFALTDYTFRVCDAQPKTSHSHVDAIRFEGGLLNGVRIAFSPNMNCLIGIQGSGKSSVLECLRYALDIPFGEKAEDRDYKKNLVPYVLQSGGKVVVEATDRHGTKYEIRRILNHAPDVYVGGSMRPGVSVRETVICKPLYFGQKDLSAAGKGFGQDLVEKLVGDSLKVVRAKIESVTDELETGTDALQAVQSDADEKLERDGELADINFRLEQFDKHGVKAKLEKQVEFKADAGFCDAVDEAAEGWRDALEQVVAETEESIDELELPESKANAAFFKKYLPKLDLLKKSVVDAKALLKGLSLTQTALSKLHDELDAKAESLKDEFAKTERDLLKALQEQGVTSIQPDAYVNLTKQKSKLEAAIAELKKKTSKETSRKDALFKAIVKLNETWLDEFKQISVSLNRINVAQTALQVQAAFKGDKGSFQTKLEEVMRGSNIRKDSLQALTDKYADFGDLYRDLDEASKLVKGKSDEFQGRINENLFDLLSFKVPNSYIVTYHGKALKSHSLGQRASAMMLFLLSQDGNDLLLVDQPEDDLDSQTVYEEVVKLVRKLKANRQFIFATHNANFPVLGDSETVASCAATETAIAVVSGSIDAKESQSKIVSIMEGGVEAFERRRLIYEIWKAE